VNPSLETENDLQPESISTGGFEKFDRGVRHRLFLRFSPRPAMLRLGTPPAFTRPGATRAS
jgi:hypothetical protein